MNAEEKLYQQVESRSGGWRGEASFRLVCKQEVADDTIAFSFARDNYSGSFDFTPGQFLTIRIPSLGAAPRHYTVTSPPGSRFLQCTTRKVNGGEVSTYMHNLLQEGDVVLLGVPCGMFRAQTSELPKVLISAGIGITPCWAFLQQFGKEKVKAVLHMEKSQRRHAYKEDFERSGVPCTWLYTEHGRPDMVAALETLLSDPNVSTSAEFYVCGPSSFMSAIRDTLAALGATQVFAEIFGTNAINDGQKPACPFTMVMPSPQRSSCPFMSSSAADIKDKSAVPATAALGHRCPFLRSHDGAETFAATAGGTRCPFLASRGGA